jgi:3',5'-cyclic AMP phosphodiesterase CpdA
MASIRILHASDLHISTRASYTSGWDIVSPGVSLNSLGKIVRDPFDAARRLRRTAFLSTYDPDPLGAFARLVYDVQTKPAHAHELRTPVDAVVLTGDISTSGLQHDLELVREFLEGPANGPDAVVSDGGFPTLAHVNAYAGGDTPVWILPGNHDRYRRVRATLNIDYSPGGRNFEKVLGSYWGKPFPGQPDWGPDVVEFPTLTKGGLNVTVIAADFNLRHKRDRVGPRRNKYAQGRVYPEIVEELRSATEAARAAYGQPHVVLWAVHFPPRFPGIGDSMRLIDEDWLVGAAESLGVAAIMSGHTHEQLEYPVSNPRPEGFCGGTATQHFAPLGNRLRVIEISDDARGNVTVQHEHYLYDDLAEDFLKV